MLNRSASLPQMGVVAVEVSSMAVTTQAYWLWVPLRSARIVGRALETTVEDRMATSSASNRPVNAFITCRCGIGAGAAGTGAAGQDAGCSGADVVRSLRGTDEWILS